MKKRASVVVLALLFAPIWSVVVQAQTVAHWRQWRAPFLDHRAYGSLASNVVSKAQGTKTQQFEEFYFGSSTTKFGRRAWFLSLDLVNRREARGSQSYDRQSY